MEAQSSPALHHLLALHRRVVLAQRLGACGRAASPVAIGMADGWGTSEGYAGDERLLLREDE